MNFECTKCGGWNTYAKNAYEEGSEGVCFDCKIFYTMGKPKVNWENIRNFIILFVSGMMLLYLFGVLK